MSEANYDCWIVTRDLGYDRGVWVEAVALIRNNATGEVRSYPTEEPFREGDPHPSVFNWKENNFRCDCNRRIFFERAAGIETDDERCGDGGFSVNLVNAKTGLPYYTEFTPTNPAS